MNCFLIDDHVLFREGLRFILSDIDEDIHFFEASTAEEALSIKGDKHIDVVLLDYHMPGTDGLSGLEMINEAFDGASVVVLSSEDNPDIIRKSIENGASGFIPKSSSADVLLAALKLILAGDTYLPAMALTNVNHVDISQEHSDVAENPMSKLTRRQTQVLMMAIQGKVNKVIAREMFICEGTVKAHLSAAFRALGVHNRTEAVYIAAKYGLNATMSAIDKKLET